jgi:hypothetical protein
MHTDEGKIFDKRNVERNIKEGTIAQKDYEIYISKLPDAGDKIFNPEEPLPESPDLDGHQEEGLGGKKKGLKKKVRGKGK